MIELHADDWYTVTGRGRCAVFARDNQPPGVHPRDLLGQQVTVDGKRYEVKGVDHYAIDCPRPDAADKTVCGHPFGLLLEGT